VDAIAALPAARQHRIVPRSDAPVTHRLDAAALLAACQNADPATRASAFRQLGRVLYRLTYARVHDRPDLHGAAEDAAQEALVAVWRQLEAGRGPDAPERFVGWAARIAINRLLDALRRLEPEGTAGRTLRVAQSRQVSLEAEPETGQPLAERLADPEGEAWVDRAHAGAVREVLWRIRDVASVSERSRIVLLQGYLGDLDDAELAERLGTSRANVHVIRCRDLAKLRADRAFVAALREALDG
jgi:RNA polymerase sigma factor (sigma-70 family)